jgi:uncharacterized membrane protein YphA (DoxX/SURF4 family)
MRVLDVGALGRIIVGLALIGFGVENILFGHYVVARAAPWPTDLTARFAVACVTAAVFLACGAALVAGRFVRPAGLTAATLILGWSLVLHVPVAVAGPAWSGDWTNALKAGALAAGLLAVAAADGRRLNAGLAALRTIAPCVAGAFFLLCGIQHFLFAGFVATLVPRFIPGAYFWTYFAGIALIAAGIGFCTPPLRRLTAWLAATMVFSWVFLVHVPLIFTVGPGEWMGVFEALGISGVCLALAEASLESGHWSR